MTNVGSSQYVLAAWTVLCFSDPFRDKLKISSLFIVFLSCIVLDKVRLPSAANSVSLRMLKGVYLAINTVYKLRPLRSSI